MLKKIIITFIDLIVRLYPAFIASKLHYYRNVLYSHWIKLQLGSVGEKSTIGKGLQIQGGGGIRLPSAPTQA
jgi:hypothetical protein